MKINDVKKLIPFCIKANIPLYLHGVHGIGKTELVLQWAKDNNYNVLVWPLSLMEPGDILGCPEIVNGRTITAPPVDLPTEGNWIVFIDELNRARVDTQNAAFKFVDDTIPRYKRPKSVYIMAAGNPSDIIRDETGKKQQAYHVTELDPALASRFLHIRVEPSANEWIDFASQTSHDKTVIDFVKGYQESLGYTQIALPPLVSRARGLTFLSALRKVDLPHDLQEEVAMGLLGTHFATTFMSFLESGEVYVKFKQLLESNDEDFATFRRHKESGRMDLVNKSMASMENYMFELDRAPTFNEGKIALKMVLELSKDIQLAIIEKIGRKNEKIMDAILGTADEGEKEKIRSLKEEIDDLAQ